MDDHDTMSDARPFPTGRTVPFPYETPYPQQLDLMDTILTGLRNKREQDKEDTAPSSRAAVMMLESPTGTGKSLSVAASAMAWLRHIEQEDFKQANESAQVKQQSETTGLDWLDSWVPPEQREQQEEQERVKEKAKESRKLLVEELSKLQSKLSDAAGDRQRARRENLLRAAVTSAKLADRKENKRKRRKVPSIKPKTNTTEDFILQDYRSEDEKNNNSDSDTENQDANKYRKSAAAALLDGPSLDGSGVGNHITHALGNVQPGSGVRKIIYAARTHSQLSQFVGELRRTVWGSNVRLVALGGRKALCGNHELRGKTDSVINEVCLDLQKGKTDDKKRCSAIGCPLLTSRQAIDTLALHMLARPTDIEEASSMGDSTQTCAYYASRTALAAAEVVVLPYSMLLSKQTRDAIGLSLKESLVIVDEAHNLPEALRSLHSCRLSLPVVNAALDQLGAYTTKYTSRLAGRNLYYLGQLRKILLALQKQLDKPNEKIEGRMITPGELLIESRLDNVNLFKILRYLERSRLPQKLLGFSNHKTSDEKEGATFNVNGIPDGLSKHVSAMSIVQTFLEKLTFSGKEGKIVIDRPAVNSLDAPSRVQHPTLRYVLLHPAAFFENVLNEAHALALVGGTLRPFVHVAAELLGGRSDVLKAAAKADTALMQTSLSNSYVSPAFTAFTCDHVVSSSNVLLQCLSKGPTGKTLDFRHQSRSTNAVCDELGRTLVELCQKVPSGVVVFLPSYSYEAHLVRRWRQSGLWKDLQKVKKLHREPKSSQQVEMALSSFARDAPGGALLLSVVGGKMSEGINFSNDMARCVVVVGLPYPDITDPELKEKMRNIDQAAEQTITGQAYYQNLCMRAVNQSVGRAIRHAKDYAAIALIDSRYQTDSRIWSGLPNWLKRGAGSDWRKHVPFAVLQQELKSFFDRHRT